MAYSTPDAPDARRLVKDSGSEGYGTGSGSDSARSRTPSPPQPGIPPQASPEVSHAALVEARLKSQLADLPPSMVSNACDPKLHWSVRLTNLISLIRDEGILFPDPYFIYRTLCMFDLPRLLYAFNEHWLKGHGINFGSLMLNRGDFGDQDVAYSQYLEGNKILNWNLKSRGIDGPDIDMLRLPPFPPTSGRLELTLSDRNLFCMVFIQGVCGMNNRFLLPTYATHIVDKLFMTINADTLPLSPEKRKLVKFYQSMCAAYNTSEQLSLTWKGQRANFESDDEDVRAVAEDIVNSTQGAYIGKDKGPQLFAYIKEIIKISERKASFSQHLRRFSSAACVQAHYSSDVDRRLSVYHKAAKSILQDLEKTKKRLRVDSKYSTNFARRRLWF